ncbi:MAG TPA: glycerol-3-phosphate acyltransferase [Acidimicrobiia bacterium]|nr:glycerol-3-phosphate acyltransferase [Acidimicrobiia bacterium]
MTLALVVGFVVGTLPAADMIGRLRGVDLRRAGSGNPGTANALRVIGRGAATTILVIDLLKGAAAAAFGLGIAGDATGTAAAVAAIAGQVLNPWFGFHGGKGLGVTAGAAIVIWPLGLALVLPTVALGAVAYRAAVGAIAGLIAFLGLSMLWASEKWSTAWGIAADDTLVWFSIGVCVLTIPKFVGDLTERFSAPEPHSPVRG